MGFVLFAVLGVFFYGVIVQGITFIFKKYIIKKYLLAGTAILTKIRWPFFETPMNLVYIIIVICH